MIAAARDAFISEGYASTTMNDIAGQAGVAVQTVYYTFRTKALLLREAMEVTVVGRSDPATLTERPWTAEILAGTTPQRILALSTEHGTAVYERAAPLWPAVRAASLTDPAVDEYWREVAAARRVGMGRIVAKLEESGSLRSNLSVERATDLVYTLAGHETFQSLVLDAGWSVTEFKLWLFETLVSQLLGQVPIDPDAVAGLSFEDLNRS